MPAFDLNDLTLAATAGSVSLAVCAVVWSLAQRRRMEGQMARLQFKLKEAHLTSAAAQASTEAFDSALIAVDDGAAMLASGLESLIACATALEVERHDAEAVVAALMRADPDHARRLKALFDRGEACAFEVRGPKGAVSVEGRASGALAWLRLTAIATEEGLPTAARFAAFVDARPEPAWVTDGDGALIWANRAWLDAVDAASVADAIARQLSFERAADALAAEAAEAGEKRETTRFSSLGGRRRSLRITAQPLDGGGVGVWTFDVTELEETREAFKRHVEAHDETLDQIAEAVAIFSQSRRLSYHNSAFAELWGLEPAWLAERPAHSEILDRLRQRRRLPETVDYAAWKTAELAHYEDVGRQADDLWHLPDGRTLKVVRQAHPLGGMLLLFSDITGELRLKAQYNSLIQVQQATLDKLNDAVAVFGSDGRLRLHNEAFATFWNVTPADLDAAGDFEGVVDLCVPRLHDMQFWRDLKGRVADPDPTARAPTSGEARTSDGRIISYLSRPLPDGATLLAFADITDTRRLERALVDRSAALAEAERLKRDFVGNVSYELRTPLTTIIGYSELLERMGEGLSDRGRAHVVAVRAAASQLARSIDDVLDMAQIDADEMALDVEDIRVYDLLADAEARWIEQAQAGKINIDLVCDPDVGLIRGDVRRIGQVLDHLLENAVRQTPPGGKVTLSAKRAVGEMRLQVSDTGRGIPFHVQAHIFDRFVGRDRGGPGLGLALVKALVELHGGWVALESEPGAGATFTCHLPEAVAGAAAQTELGF